MLRAMVRRTEAGEPLAAIHMINIALGTTPDNRAALLVRRAAREGLLVDCRRNNFSMTASQKTISLFSWQASGLNEAPA